MPLDAVLRAGRRLQAEQPGRFRLEAAGPLARGAEAPTAGGPREEARVFECAVAPDDIRVTQTEPEDGQTSITMHMSRASAFELVRQALAACPGQKDDSNFWVQEIVAHVVRTKRYGESDGGAKLRHLEEMLERWTGMELETPKNVSGKVFYARQAYNEDAGHDVLCFAIAATALAVGSAPIITGLAGIVMTVSVINRLTGYNRAERQEEQLREYLFQQNGDIFKGLGRAQNRWGLTAMRELYQWIETFLQQSLKGMYLKPTVRSFNVKFTDKLKTDEDAAAVAEDLQEGAKGFFYKRGREQ